MFVLLAVGCDADGAAVVAALEHHGFDPVVRRVTTRQQLRHALRRGAWDAIVLADAMETLPLRDVVTEAAAPADPIAVIVVSHASEDGLAAAAMDAGARDHVAMNDLGRLGPRLVRELTMAEHRRTAAEALVRSHTALDRSRIHLDALMDQLPAITWTTDTELRIASLRGAALEPVGLGPDAYLDQPIADLHADEEARGLALAAHRRALSGEASSYEFALGAHRFEAKVQPLSGPRGDIGGTLALAMDVTDARRLEAQLRATQRMEGIGRLAGGIAHDFNNVLTIIQTYSQFLAETLGEDHPGLRDLKAITDAARRAGSLTSQLLAFSRRQVLNPRPLDIECVVHEMADMLRRIIGEDIELVILGSPDPCAAKADPSQLEQVFLNLTVNARDAMPRGGRLEITMSVEVYDEARARDIHQAMRPGDYAVVRVSDTGSGMDEHTLLHAFEPFFTTKQSGKGTGLGLSTVYGIIKQSGGFVWIDSTEGAGTTFTIQLPHVGGALPPVTNEPRESPRRSGDETILLVEDDPAVRLAAHRALEREGYQVLVASNGAEALSVVHQHAGTIALVITDVVMPEMSGHELVQQLGPLRDGIRTLYMSGYSDDALGAHGPDADAALILKPFTPQSLTARVRAVLDADD